jgi:hypothetical protein
MHRWLIVTLVICGLAAPAVAAAGAPEGFTPLLTTDDLPQWECKPHAKAKPREDATEHWVLQDGVLKYDGKATNLWTKTSYKDFVLKVSWRLPKPGDSGIYVRGSSKCQANIWTSPLGSGEVWGYRTDKSMPDEVREAAKPTKKADKPVGEWNDFVITVKGERMTVVLNGETVIDNLWMKGCPPEGPIALQHHGSPLEFKDISIKVLGEEKKAEAKPAAKPCAT